ncbi:MAG: lytic murein transglycosylase B [Gammaproteobacteria bacterium]|nr:lytic murein transglycosylase B [Gammaproteobacteria bacterium]
MQIKPIKLLSIWIVLALWIMLGFPLTPPVRADVTQRADVNKFIDRMVKDHQFERNHLLKVFKKVKTDPGIIEAISRPAEAKPWHEYRPIFLTDDRIREGVKFWRQNATHLQRAYETYGVAPEIIVAIIGVETKYGKNKGKYPVMNALTTLAFDYPQRAQFFEKELEEFLLLAREEKTNPMSIKGSYAGAMGKPQFISSSYRRYAVDFDGDGKRDILNSTVDAIGSVANYFAAHQWYKDEPVAAPAKVDGEDFKAILAKGIKPYIELGELLKNGISIEEKKSSSLLTSLIQLELNKGHEYWVAFNNFYVITRYNHSELYAMAAYQLSQEIKRFRFVGPRKPSSKN